MCGAQWLLSFAGSRRARVAQAQVRACVDVKQSQALLQLEATVLQPGKLIVDRGHSLVKLARRLDDNIHIRVLSALWIVYLRVLPCLPFEEGS